MLSTTAEIQEFANRWSKARVAALKEIVGPHLQSDDELALMQALKLDARDHALKTVFNNSRKFGQSFARHHNIVLETSDLRTILPKVGGPCLSGQWHRRDESVVREKTGCFEGLKLGSFFCDYWREAIDGLTMGVSEDVLFARHASCRHGDERCVDVWFEDNGEKARAGSKGALPEWVEERCAVIVEKFKKEGVLVKFEGLSEGVLYCQITSSKKPSCSDQSNWEEILAREVSLIWPGVRLKNTTPVAVYGDKL